MLIPEHRSIDPSSVISDPDSTGFWTWASLKMNSSKSFGSDEGEQPFKARSLAGMYDERGNSQLADRIICARYLRNKGAAAA